MKPFTLLIFICVIGTTRQGQAQKDSSKTVSGTKKWNHEIGMNVYSSTIRGGNFYSNYKAAYDHYAVSGLSLKFFHGKSAIRTSIDYLQKITIERAQASPNRSLYFKTLQFAAGYQRHFGNKKVMPYVFTDLSYSYGKELIRGGYNYHYDALSFLPYNLYGYNLMAFRTSVFSVIPGIGLRLRLRKYMILNLETAAEFFYMKEFGTYYLDKFGVAGIHVKPFKCSFAFNF